MAPPRLHRLPNEQLVDLLLEARVEGLRFEDAWERAIRPGRRLVLTSTDAPPAGALRWPTDSSDRLAWRAAIFAIKDQYRRAYELRPATRRERSVTVLMAVIGVEGGIGAVAAIPSAA